jgi:hypothetical protein
MALEYHHPHDYIVRYSAGAHTGPARTARTGSEQGDAPPRATASSAARGGRCGGGNDSMSFGPSSGDFFLR